ncbi:MAG: cupin domain-containing protein [Novosphingobium sp.]
MTTDRFHFKANGWVPNNPRLPVLIWRAAVAGVGETLAEEFERLFAERGWRPDWRDGVFGYHHYHSTAHEALGVFSGRATLELGGPGGARVPLAPGDALMLPAGTGHRCMNASEDFQVVGAYPDGQDWDICREAPDQMAMERMRSLPDPPHNPV